MRPFRFRRLGPALAVCLTFLAVSVTAPGSGAATPSGGTTCASFEGSFPEGPFSLSGCSDVANTGRSGSLDNRTGVIVWATGKTTTVSYALSPVENEAREKDRCPPTAAAEFKLRGTVTADTTGSIDVGGPVIGTVCARENGVLTNARGATLKIL